jgi:hypothetical protein
MTQANRSGLFTLSLTPGTVGLAGQRRHCQRSYVASIVVIGQRARGGCLVVVCLVQERPPGAVVRAWCPKRNEEDVLWARVAVPA